MHWNLRLKATDWAATLRAGTVGGTEATLCRCNDGGSGAQPPRGQPKRHTGRQQALPPAIRG